MEECIGHFLMCMNSHQCTRADNCSGEHGGVVLCTRVAMWELHLEKGNPFVSRSPLQSSSRAMEAQREGRHWKTDCWYI